MKLRWLHYITVNIAFMLPYLLAKPVSLNDIIAAESKHALNFTSTPRNKGITFGKFAHDKSLGAGDLKSRFNKLSDLAGGRLFHGKTVGADAIKSRINNLSDNSKSRFSLFKSVTKDLKNIFNRDSDTDAGTLKETVSSDARQRKRVKTAKESVPEQSLISKTFDRFKPKNFKILGDILSRNKRKPSLKLKPLEIQTPLKSKKYTQEQASRFKRRNQSQTKRESDSYEEFRKYVPLLRNFGMLVDNLLTSVSGETFDHKYGRKWNGPGEGIVCSCSRKPDSNAAESQPVQEAVVPTTAPKISAESSTTETASSTANPTPNSDIGNGRPNKNLPLLPARNTTSARRNNNGIRQRNRPAFHRDAKGNISGDNGDSEYDSRREKSHFDAANDEEDTDGDSRDRASDDERIGASGVGELRPVFRRNNKNKTTEGKELKFRRVVDEFEGKNHIEVRGDETEGARVIPKHIQKPGREIPGNKVDFESESVRSKEDDDEDFDDVRNDISDDKRIADGNITFAAKDQTTSQANEAVITIKDLSNPILLLQSTPTNKAPVVTIFDGYSVADKNGVNSFANSDNYEEEKYSY